MCQLLHSAFSQPTISAIFKGNPSAHCTVKLYVFHLTSGVHGPAIVACLSFLFLPLKTYSRMEFVSVCCQTHYLSSKITLSLFSMLMLGGAWCSRSMKVTSIQPQRQCKQVLSFIDKSAHPLPLYFIQKIRVKQVVARCCIVFCLKPAWLILARTVLSLCLTAKRTLVVRKCIIFPPLMLMRLCWNPWVRVAFIVHWLFHVRESLQTFKLIIYLRPSCLPCQAAALLLVPACAPVYGFASHKANLY